jgi:hypothetical protein
VDLVTISTPQWPLSASRSDRERFYTAVSGNVYLSVSIRGHHERPLAPNDANI